MNARTAVSILLGVALSWLGSPASAGDAKRAHAEHSVDALLALDVRPVAIAHRGFGVNLGEDRTRPIENTVRAVRRGFHAGASVVEVDVQLTADGRLAVFHDDFLDDFTCINQLTLAELQRRERQIPTLEDVLDEARRAGHGAGLHGILIVELKPAAPLCDPHDLQDEAIVSAVARIIRDEGMGDRTLLASLSPALLFLAAGEAPEIARVLTISGLQLLGAAEIEALLGLPVTPIDKGLAVGLQWAEVGPIYRLPGYASASAILTTAATVNARVIEADLGFWSSAGAPFVDASHALGFRVFGFTVTNIDEWVFLESLGVDGIYTDDVRLGVDQQPAIR